MPRPWVIHGALVLLTLVWGSTWAVIKVGLVSLPPFTGAALRFALAGLLLLAVARLLGIALGRRPWERRLWVINGLCSFFLCYGIVYWAQQWVPSALASVLFATFPLCVAVLAHYLLPGERLRVGSTLGILIGFFGVVVIFSEDLERLGGEELSFAAILMLLSPMVSSVGSVAVKKWGQGIHPISINAWPMLLSGLGFGTLAALLERDRPVVLDGVGIGSVVYLAVVGSVLTFTVYFWLLKHLSATGLSLLAYTIPLVATAIGVGLLGEPFTVRLALGAALVVGGVALASRTSARASRG